MNRKMAVFGSDELQGEFQGWREKIADREFWEQLETLLLIAWSSEMFLAYSFVTEGLQCLITSQKCLSIQSTLCEEMGE